MVVAQFSVLQRESTHFIKVRSCQGTHRDTQQIYKAGLLSGQTAGKGLPASCTPAEARV